MVSCCQINTFMVMCVVLTSKASRKRFHCIKRCLCCLGWMSVEGLVSSIIKPIAIVLVIYLLVWFFPVASRSSCWLSICPDSGFIHSLLLVELVQGFRIVSREGALDAAMIFVKCSELFNPFLGWVHPNLFGHGILVLLKIGMVVVV